MAPSLHLWHTMRVRPLLCVTGLLLACRAPAPPPHHQSTSTVALSSDDKLLYVVETDSATLTVLSTSSDQKLADVPVGAGAHLVAVGPDDTAYVANRLDGSLTVVHVGDWSNPERWEAGPEPVGLALGADGRFLYVVTAVARDTATYGELLAFDTHYGTLQWRLALGPEPRSIAVIDDTHAVVTQLKGTELLWIDLHTPAVMPPSEHTLDFLLNAESGSLIDRVHPRDMRAVAVSPDGTSVVALASLARTGALDTRDTCVRTLTAPAALLKLQADRTPLVDTHGTCAEPLRAGLPTLVATQNALAGVGLGGAWIQQGGSAIAFEETGTFVYVAHSQGNAISWGGVAGSDGWNATTVGRFPDGLTIKRDSTVGYVHNAFDHTVMKLVGTYNNQVEVTKTLTIGADVLPADIVEGRKLFFDATNPALTSSSHAAACATCHLDGEEDGHVWRLEGGGRQTPSLSGGRLDGTAPFHWAGDALTLDDAIAHAVTRAGGIGLSAQQLAQLEAFIAQLPAPLNPKRTGALSDRARHGQVVFSEAGCLACHAGPKLTDNAFADVGTELTGFSPSGVNVPSLLGVARTAPYLHDGSAATLRQRLAESGDRHGHTTGLSADDLDDLVEFLERL